MARWRLSSQRPMSVIHSVSNSLAAMGVLQYLLAFTFLASYSLALGQFSGRRGRGYAAAGAFASAVCFVVLSDPWENGVLVVAFGLITVGGLAASVWGMWVLLSGEHAAAHAGVHQDRFVAPQSHDDPLSTVAAALDVLRRPRRLARAGHPQR